MCTRATRRPDQQRRDAPPRHLDLGQLGHARRSPTSAQGSRRARSAPGGTGTRPSAARTSAADCARRRRSRRRAADGVAARPAPRARARPPPSRRRQWSAASLWTSRRPSALWTRGCRAVTAVSASGTSASKVGRTAARSGRRRRGRGRRGSERSRDRSRSRRRRRHGRPRSQSIEPCGVGACVHFRSGAARTPARQGRPRTSAWLNEATS